MKFDAAWNSRLRRWALVTSCAAVAVVLLTGFLIIPAGAQITIKLSTPVPDGTSWAAIIKEAADKWKKISGGRVIVNVYWGSVSGDDPDVVRKMRLGTLHAAVLTSIGIADIDKSVYALGVPMMYTSYDEVYGVLERMRAKLEASIEKKGFIVLNWVDGGWVHYFTQTPVATPDDLRKLKIFAWENDTETVDIMKSLGFKPQPMPTAEILTALQTGRINAVPVSPQVAVISQYYHYAKNMTDLNWELLLGATVIDKRAWNRIPADLHVPLLAVTQESGKKLRDEIRKSSERDVAEMQKRGLNLVPVDAKARDAWVKVAESAYPRIRDRIVGAEAFDEAMTYRDEVRKRAGTLK